MSVTKEIFFREILIPHGTVKRMSEREGFSEHTISMALKHPAFTKVQMYIREVALSDYGCILIRPAEERGGHETCED